MMIGPPSWLLDPNATVDIDFTTRRAWGASIGGLSVTTASGGYAQNLDGSWQLFPANTLRLTDKGLLAEEQRTNLFLNSLAPVTQTITVANATVYTVSLYASGGTLTLSGAGAGTVSANGTVTFTSTTTSLTVTVNSVTGAFQCVNVEAGAYKTSPIVTAGASAARAADIIKLTSIPWFNASAGTLYAEANSPTPTTASRVVAGFSNNTTSERYRLGAFSGGMFGSVDTGGVAQAFFSSGTNTPDVTFKTIIAFAANDIAWTQTGVAPQTDTVATLPTVTQMDFGQLATTQQWVGYIRRVAYWNTRLANATLQSLTA